MKNTMKILGIIALVAVIIFSTAACRGKSESAGADDVSAAIGLDKIIDEYEVIVNDFVASFQKVMDGDMEAAAEMEELEAKLEAIYEQMAIYEEEATEEQIQRVSDISEKLGFGF